MDYDASHSQEAQVSLRVTIEGNIASGKSNFLDWFRSDEDFIMLGEPVRMWESVGRKLTRAEVQEPT
jgi:dephospho-CoA kinase